MFYNRNLLNFCEAQGKDIFGLGMHFKAFLAADSSSSSSNVVCLSVVCLFIKLKIAC